MFYMLAKTSFAVKCIWHANNKHTDLIEVRDGGGKKSKVSPDTGAYDFEYNIGAMVNKKFKIAANNCGSRASSSLRSLETASSMLTRLTGWTTSMPTSQTRKTRLLKPFVTMIYPISTVNCRLAETKNIQDSISH